MNKSLKISLALVFAIAATFIALLAYQAVSPLTASAHDTGEEHEHEEDQDENSEEQESESAAYTYNAQPGDTYTQIARKAIQTYGIDNDVNLTSAGIIFAETNVTREAGAEQLAVGQEVSIDQELISKWVESASELTDEEQAAWNTYVPFVNFNTDAVGQETSS